jgi:hypothetical protein
MENGEKEDICAKTSLIFLAGGHIYIENRTGLTVPETRERDVCGRAKSTYTTSNYVHGKSRHPASQCRSGISDGFSWGTVTLEVDGWEDWRRIAID